MKITKKILSLPPYISTRWEFISSLHVNEGVLTVHLKDGTTCSVPDLSKETLATIFTHHVETTETAPDESEEITKLMGGIRSGFKDVMNMFTKLGANAMTSLGKVLEHDPNHANLPDLPPEMIKKVELLLNIIPQEDLLDMPESVPGCNCMYCQINRILRHAKLDQPDFLEQGGEPVEETELEFTEWIVENIEDKIYKVTNKLDPNEEYRVFLGNPIGCTCGKEHCEHILAVLRS